MLYLSLLSFRYKEQMVLGAISEKCYRILKPSPLANSKELQHLTNEHEWAAQAAETDSSRRGVCASREHAISAPLGQWEWV